MLYHKGIIKKILHLPYRFFSSHSTYIDLSFEIKFAVHQSRSSLLYVCADLEIFSTLICDPFNLISRYYKSEASGFNLYHVVLDFSYLTSRQCFRSFLPVSPTFKGFSFSDFTEVIPGFVFGFNPDALL